MQQHGQTAPGGNMSRAGLGCLGGLLLIGSMQGLGVVVLGIGLLGVVGKFVGENAALITIYVVAAMGASYFLPIVAAIYHREVRWLFLVPLATTFLFAFPSSFVASYGCKDGREIAPWAMRAIPLLWLGETVLAPEDEKISCETF
ncbi:hypothetical protein OG875_30935 [Streptomyces sp. NBC_01498]|uniref:hypothetical protein n=1 Tax=Streptomyces sp. NBC_01498 TaxID=2975870 RepID=UPI002E7AB3BE|nr:hypothetical protein [Streptomyces sp. NBC_01498]WTL28613.1 hypothetical protein OG875_30935 [Streptomyces sp. NBC_01498]